MPLANGWTGGQYSLFRLGFGAYLLIHFTHLLPWGPELYSSRGVLPDGSASPLLHLFPNVLALMDSPVAVTALLAIAAAASSLFAIGLYDRVTAVVIWYVLACTFGRNPLIGNPGLPYVGWMLLAHACIAAAPFGSWRGRRAPDAGAGWRMPPEIFAAAWTLMALGYSYSGYTKLVSPSWIDGTAIAHVLANPLARPGWLREALLAAPPTALRLATWSGLGLELAFAPLALIRSARPWLWSAMLGMHVTLMTLIDFADLSLGLVMLHVFTFDPAWIRPRAGASETLFYDGHCGVCHALVRWVISEDRGAQAFRFAPLAGPTYQAALGEAERRAIGDSVVVRSGDGRLLTRSSAVLHVAQRLGGAWRLLAVIGRLIPRPLRDGFYDRFARVRRVFFSAPPDVCPVLPADLRVRFDA